MALYGGLFLFAIQKCGVFCRSAEVFIRVWSWMVNGWLMYLDSQRLLINLLLKTKWDPRCCETREDLLFRRVILDWIILEKVSS